MGRYARRKYKTKRRKREVDQIFEDLSSPESIQKLKHQACDEDKPGLGQYYCVHCAKYFQDNGALAQHLKTKVHKRRVKLLKVNPFTTLEAEAAAGFNLEEFTQKVANYHTSEPLRKQMETQILSNQLEENEQKDRERFAQLFPDKAKEEEEQETQKRMAKGVEAMATD
ncbi:hypothetical protein FOA43_000011 [Brettanomyces nanus]|uniref:C2H2-type domain-containing protein n=1 Tax=Eeniella nana TaxID=13502 RepID=A0A875RMU3_EENNA|nr:uncharacterized protein FOA43_000011 [Brettanomyces nanus]QPG72710.1 hypothetical protein FOA43_000011 [Brettanomyces nanus]